MSDIYSLDFETYSAAGLKKVGAYRYACDPSTEILIFAIAKNDGPVYVWDALNSFNQNKQALSLFEWAVNSDAIIYAHNVQFEAAICKYLMEKTFYFAPPKLDQWRCTAAMARRAAIPSSLEGVGKFLGLDVTKDKAGEALIRKFSIPRKPTKKDTRTRILPQDDPEAFREFGEYCRRDVETERAAHKVLHAFELEGAVLDAFQFDLWMNDHGVPVNVEALKRADKMINEYTERLTEQFRKITGLNPTQRDKSHVWLRERGYPFPNLQAGNVDMVLENGPTGWETRYISLEDEQNLERPVAKLRPVEMTDEAFEALRIRSLVSYAAVKKIPTMLGAVCPDGRVRGALMWSGAERTHRWTGKIIQPQNFRRPSFKGTEQAYKMLCEGVDIDTLELLFAPFLEIVASCIRHFIQLPSGQEVLQADYSSVEARGAAWLCGGERKLQMFRDGAPVYENMAAKIFGKKVKDVDKDERFIGKQSELGCTYNMGRPKYRGTCESYGFMPPPFMVEEFKPRFRRELALMRAKLDNPEPWDEFEIKFPKFIWARPRNGKHGRELGVYAYRKAPAGKPSVARKIIDPDNPTSEEWLDLTYDDLADRAVTTWRVDNPEIVQAWKSMDTAAKQAIQNPGKIFKGTDKISFGVTEKPGFRALVMRLPSGHTLIYPRPKLVWKGEEGKPNWSDYYNIEIHFWGKENQKWGWVKTYGGKLLENATQAICGDLMAHGAVNAWRHGYKAIMLVHDEALAEFGPGQSVEELCRLLCELPPWAKGMPLEAEGNVIPFYTKT